MPITNSKKKIIIIVIAILILLICGIFAFFAHRNTNDIDKYLDLGSKYLEEQDYDKAIAAYTEALEIDNMNVSAYIGLADAYIGNNDIEDALEILDKGYNLTGSEDILDKINQIKQLQGNSSADTENAEWVDSLTLTFNADNIVLGQSTIDEAKSAYSGREDYLSNLMNEDTEDTVYSMPYIDNPNSGHDEMEFGYLFSAPVDTMVIYFIVVHDSSITCSGNIKIGDDINSLFTKLSCPLTIEDISDTDNLYTSSTGKSLSVEHEDDSVIIKYSDGEKYISFDIRNNTLYGIAMGYMN